MSADLMLKVKKLIKQYYEHYGKLPGKIWLREKANIPDYKIALILGRLAEEGFLTKNKTRYVMGTTTDKPKVIEQPINTVSEAIARVSEVVRDKKPKPKAIPERKPDWVIGIIRAVMGIIGIGCISMSIFFTFNFAKSFLHPFWALSLSLYMIGFSVASFECLIIFKKNKQFGIIAVFLILWIITTLFSMNSTYEVLSDRQNDVKVTAVEDNREVIQGNSLLEFYNNKQIELNAEKELILADIVTYQNVIANIDGELAFNPNYSTAYTQKTNAEKSLVIIKEGIKANDAEIENLLKQGIAGDIVSLSVQSVVSTSESPGMFLGITQIDTLVYSFLMNLFPAIFIDIMAPLSIAIALFLRRKENG